jgi:hypothetical protein
VRADFPQGFPMSAEGGASRYLRDPETTLQFDALCRETRVPWGWLAPDLPGHALVRPCAVAVIIAGFPPTALFSPPSSVLRPPLTPAAPRSLSPSAYTSRVAPARAAQTGLSCSVSVHACCAPYPAEIVDVSLQ